jgi:hypothetical protein
VKNGTLIVNAKCSNCRTGDERIGSTLDVQSTSQPMIFASGPIGALNTDNLAADLKRHDSYGVFQVDMKKATGPGGVPLPEIPTSDEGDQGAVEKSQKNDHNFAAPLHAAIMVFTFVGLMPLGLVILRVLGWPKWHGINQTFAAVLALIGAALGIVIGRWFNRTRKFNSGHQIFGVIIIVALLVQAVLGFMHHRIFKMTNATTKMAPVHVWLGRIVIFGGIMNSFMYVPSLPLLTSPVLESKFFISHILMMNQGLPTRTFTALQLLSHCTGYSSSTSADTDVDLEAKAESKESKGFG